MELDTPLDKVAESSLAADKLSVSGRSRYRKGIDSEGNVVKVRGPA